jgi:hypothetical protein
VKNLGVEGADITGKDYVGGITGYISNNGTVTNCYSTGTINGDKYVGGITGGNGVGGTVTNCYSACNVSGNKFVGGITGFEGDAGRTANCYSTGAVSGNNSVGGIAGLVSGGLVINCAALNPSVKGTENVGRVAGLVNAGGTCTNNLAFAGISIPKKNTGNNGIGITPDEISGDGTLGGRFTEADGWTTENGRLPGQFGETVDIPDYILNWKPGMDIFMIMIFALGIIAAVMVLGFVLYRSKKKN